MLNHLIDTLMTESAKQSELSLSISVIIPTCHRNDLLAKCLDCLAPGKQTLNPSCYEIIVTDDGSQSTAKNLIQEKYPWVQWIKGPQKGPAANRNNGAKHAKGEWLVFTDDDCLPEPVWLETYFKSIKQYPTAKAFEGAIHPTSWEELKKDLAECPINIQGNCFWSANIAIESKLYWNIGGFDEEFLVAAQEDQDIFFKVKKMTDVIFIKNAKVYHPIRKVNLIKKIKGIKASTKNYYMFILKNEFLKKGILLLYIENVYSLLLSLVVHLKNLNLRSIAFEISRLFIGSYYYLYFTINKPQIKKNENKK